MPATSFFRLFSWVSLTLVVTSCMTSAPSTLGQGSTHALNATSPEACLQLKTQIDEAFKAIAYCNTDADCALAKGLPMGYACKGVGFNRAADTTGVKQMLTQYSTECPTDSHMACAADYGVAPHPCGAEHVCARDVDAYGTLPGM